ncbi:hypothetical protein CN514_05980 [Bacillus sp. AFS001701]|nr:hypothetical protein CN514_05980 [Bacillus sp. AFS001701]
MSIENEKSKTDKYDGVHFLVFFTISIFCDYLKFGDIIFPILFLLYFIFSFYYLEKWTKGKIIKYLTIFLLLFVIGKVIKIIF